MTPVSVEETAARAIAGEAKVNTSKGVNTDARTAISVDVAAKKDKKEVLEEET